MRGGFFEMSRYSVIRASLRRSLATSAVGSACWPEPGNALLAWLLLFAIYRDNCGDSQVLGNLRGRPLPRIKSCTAWRLNLALNRRCCPMWHLRGSYPAAIRDVLQTRASSACICIWWQLWPRDQSCDGRILSTTAAGRQSQAHARPAFILGNGRARQYESE